MPGIYLFGRRWMAASDGLVFAFGISVVLRVAWLTIISIIFGIHSEILHTGVNSSPSEAQCKQKASVYLLGYVTLLAVISIIECLLCFSSSRGTIFEEDKRQAVVPLLYVRFGLFLVELTWQLIGFIWIFSSHASDNCPSILTKRLAEGAVICSCLFMIGTFFVIYIAFDSAGRLWPKMQSSRDRASRYGAIDIQIRTHYEKKWEKSVRALFCCTKKESSMENVFSFVSSLLSDYFQDYSDLVPSDIVAGLILLRRRQKYLESRNVKRSLPEREEDEKAAKSIKGGQSHRCVHRFQKTGSAKSFNFSNAFDSKILKEVTHFSSYALAIYGWPFYLYDRIFCGVCNLCCKIRCCAGCCRPSKKDFILVEDNCCECNIEATRLFLKDRDHELIYVSYKDEVYQPPFFVALDHKKKAVVVSCRGTLSLKDVLTDVMVEEERIPVQDGEENWMGHKGMIQSAQYVLDILIKEEILDYAFNYNAEQNTQSYKLMIVGHSLGAGVASVLAFLLRPKYPDLICFAYSAVGATFNYEASKYAKDFIYSIVIGKDVISRLNLHTLDELRYMVIELLRRTNLPKWKIMRRCLCQCMFCCQATAQRSHEDYLDYEFHDIPEYEPPSPKRYFMGGKVIHIVKTQSIYPKYFGEKKAVYEAVWADVEDFQSILISNLMWKDHVPDTVKVALESCVSQLRSDCEDGTLGDAERSQVVLKREERISKPEEEARLLDGREDQEASSVVIQNAGNTDEAMKAESPATGETFRKQLEHSTEVRVEIHAISESEMRDPCADKEVGESQAESKLYLKRGIQAENQYDATNEDEKGMDVSEGVVRPNEAFHSESRKFAKEISIHNGLKDDCKEDELGPLVEQEPEHQDKSEFFGEAQGGSEIDLMEEAKGSLRKARNGETGDEETSSLDMQKEMAIVIEETSGDESDFIILENDCLYESEIQENSSNQKDAT